MIIRWCSCNRRILKTKYIEQNLPCELCQEEEAKRHNERFHREFDLKKEE